MRPMAELEVVMKKWDALTDEQQDLILGGDTPENSERLREIKDELKLIQPYKDEYCRRRFFGATE